MFYFICFLMGLFAASIVIWPLVRRARVSDSGLVEGDSGAARSGLQALYRARHEELERESNDPDLLQELRTDLDLTLLAEPLLNAISGADCDPEIGSETGSGSKSGSGAKLGTRAIMAVALLVPMFAGAIYMSISDPRLLALQGAQQVLSLSEEDVVGLESWQIKLTNRVMRVPEDDISWYLLGRTHLKRGEFEAAIAAFESAHNLVGDELNVLLYWLQARYLDQRGLMDEFSHSLAQKLLLEHPDFPVVLEMLALDAFRREDYRSSIRYLNRAQRSTSDPRQKDVFGTAIEQVRANLQRQSGGTEQMMPAVTVEVAAMSKVPADGVIFVAARPVGGGMPYAAVRRAANSVPLTVRLDDLVTLDENRMLSSAEQFEVVVRLSLEGVARAAPGDWVWRSQTLSLQGNSQLTLMVQLKPPDD